MATIDRKLRASAIAKRDYPNDGLRNMYRAKRVLHEMPKVPALAKDRTPETREQEIARLIRTYGTGNNGHSLFSPSSSAGWMNCKGYILANATKADMAGYDAAYGTVAHDFAAKWLTAIRDDGKKRAERVPKQFLGTTGQSDGHTVEIDANMVHHVRRYIDYCAEVEVLGDVFIEQHVDYSSYTPIPEQGGTADHFVCIPATRAADGSILRRGRLIITDLKMGHLKVDVKRNSQAMLYALGVFLEWNWFYSFGSITLRIAQPRLDSFETDECSDIELLVFGEEVRAAADAGWRENAPRSPSPKACQWCKDKLCPARSALLADLTDDAFEVDEGVIEGITPPFEYGGGDVAIHQFVTDKPVKMEVNSQNVALAVWRYRHRGFFEKYFREIGEELLRLAQSGVNVPGMKVTRGRRSFSWLDAEHAAQELSIAGLLEKDIFVTEVTSVNKAATLLKAFYAPSKIETLLYGDGKKKTGLVQITPGKPTLVSEKDERIDVEDAADDAFDDDDEL